MSTHSSSTPNTTTNEQITKPSEQLSGNDEVQKTPRLLIATDVRYVKRSGKRTFT